MDEIALLFGMVAFRVTCYPEEVPVAGRIP